MKATERPRVCTQYMNKSIQVIFSVLKVKRFVPLAFYFLIHLDDSREKKTTLKNNRLIYESYKKTTRDFKESFFNRT